jgi:pyruvate/oxaloacetate carboxyltransferase
MTAVRPGSLLEPGWEKAKAESAGFTQSDEDVLTYALFPEAGMAFLKKKYHL